MHTLSSKDIRVGRPWLVSISISPTFWANKADCVMWSPSGLPCATLGSSTLMVWHSKMIRELTTGHSRRRYQWCHCSSPASMALWEGLCVYFQVCSLISNRVLRQWSERCLEEILWWIPTWTLRGITHRKSIEIKGESHTLLLVCGKKAPTGGQRIFWHVLHQCQELLTLNSW
jgi:hypothetical protein